MLATFGTYCVVKDLGIPRTGGQSLQWPGGDASILALLAGWFLLSRGPVALRRRSAPITAVSASAYRTADLVTEEA
jgi:hypothetical protein